MTTAIDSQIDAIYRKHMAAVQRLDGTWIDASVFRYALSMAMEELAGSVQAAPVDQRVAEHSAAQIVALNEWLAERAPDHYMTPTDTATATIALLNDLSADNARLREEISRMSARVVELSDRISKMRDADALAKGEIANLRQQLTQLDADNAALIAAKSVTTPHTNGAGLRTDVAEPTVAAAVEPNDWHQRIAVWFADNVEVLDWYESIHAGRNAFRNLPKEARWHLIAFIVRSLRNAETGEWPTMAEFDRNRPEWMSTSQAAVITFGNGRWQSVLDKAEEA